MSLKIHDLPLQDRPREKLATRGADALSDSELIAILLRTGVPGANAVEVARQLLDRFGSLGELARCNVRELAKIKGVGPAKAVQLAAAFGLGARLAREQFSRVRMCEPEVIYSLLGPEMRQLRQESLRVLLLDGHQQLIRMEEIFRGSATDCTAHPREIFHLALSYSACSIVVVHNHPSGNPAPSAADIKMTRRLREAADLLLIPLLDHLIIGQPSEACPRGFVSLRECGML